MRQAIWEPVALRELQDALVFLAERDEAAAANLQQRVEVTVSRLQHHSIGRPGRIANVLEKSVAGTSYIPAYSVLADRLHLLRFIHQRRDWPSGAWPKD